MRRYLPLCVLSVLVAYLSGCGEAPSRPSVITDRPVNPPKTSARYIQVPWDISLFFNIPGGAIVSGATTAATPGAAAEGDNLTGTYTNSTGFGGTITGVLTGSLENGTFNGTLKTITASGCPAERQFTGPLTSATLNWTPGNQVNECGGTSPLTSVAPIQVTAAPPSAPPPCTYSATIGETSFAAAGGSGTVTVTAGTGCLWFATSSAGFVTVSAGQGTGNGSVQYTVAANSTTTARTATLVVAGQTFTITQAGVPAPICTYALNGSERTFDADGGRGGVDMRAPSGCAWTAQSDAPWLTFTSGSAGNGNGAINFAVAGHSGLNERVGRITAQGQVLTVTQTGVGCVYTVTPPATSAFPTAGGTGSASVATQAGCAWSATSNVPWLTITPPPGGTGNGSVTFTVAPNPEAARTGVLTVAGREIALTQAAGACVYTVTPSTTSIPAAGGSATVGVATLSACSWTATIAPTAAWITVTSGASGTGNGTVSLAFAANTTGGPRPGTVTIAGQPVTFTQATNVGTLTGLITNFADRRPIPGATVVARIGETGAPMATPSDAAGRYTFPSVPPGTYTVDITRPGFNPARGSVGVTAGATATFDAALVPRPVTLEITWSPNPTSVDPEHPTCDSSERYCWRSTVTVRETSGNAATITSWLVRFYFPDGTPDTESTLTRTGADFAEQFGVNPIPGLATISSPRFVTQSDASGGFIDYVFSGTDPYGNAFSFTSPRLTLNPVRFSETLFAAPRRPAGPRAGDRPAGPPGR